MNQDGDPATGFQQISSGSDPFRRRPIPVMSVAANDHGAVLPLHLESANLFLVRQVESICQAENTREPDNRRPRRGWEPAEAFVIGTGQRTAMVTRDRGHRPQFLGSPAEGRDEFADQPIRLLLMPIFGPRAANIVEQGRSFEEPPSTVIGSEHFAANQAVVELQSQSSDQLRVCEIGVEKRSPGFQSRQGCLLQSIPGGQFRSPDAP